MNDQMIFTIKKQTFKPHKDQKNNNEKFALT